MALLRIYRDNKLINELELIQGRAYVAGRNAECEIPLDEGRGISRKHFEISHDGTTWQLKGFSRYRELYVGGEKIEAWVLNEATLFEVPPYRFEFSVDVILQKEPQAIPPEPPMEFVIQEPLSKISAPKKKEKTKTKSKIKKNEVSIESSQASFSIGDHTVVQAVRSSAFIRAENEKGKLYKQFKLEGNRWVAGRDIACSLFLDHPIFSRNHFEIKTEEGVYLIRDLDSSNGTKVNGTQLKAHEWNILNSGDEITVLRWTLLFELRDREFDRKLQAAAPPLRYAPQVQSEIQQPMQYSEPLQSVPNAMVFGATGSSFEWNPIRILMALLVLGGALGYIFNQPEQVQTTNMASSAPASPFDRLSPQQQQYVRDSYRLADSLFKQGRYELARQEVLKIHQLVPSYEESKNIAQLAEVALQTQMDQQRAAAREAEQTLMEEKIVYQVAECKRRFNSQTTVSEVEHCLESVMAFNPEHPQILALKAQAEQAAAVREEASERREEYQEKVRRQQALYNKAESIQRQGLPLEAVKAYEVVTRSTLPDPNNLKGKARRMIASIQQGVSNKQGALERQAEEYYRSSDLKNAILTMQKALKINPDNEVLKGRVTSMLLELRKQMQAFYQEGVLEESVGEVETAKTKWKKIIDTSVPDEEYYKKAKMKLKKYGAM